MFVLFSLFSSPSHYSDLLETNSQVSCPLFDVEHDSNSHKWKHDNLQGLQGEASSQVSDSNSENGWVELSEGGSLKIRMTRSDRSA